MAHTARLDNALISTANTATNGTGTIVSVAVGSNQGTRIDYVAVKAIANTTPGMVRLFTRETALNGWRLLAELPVLAVTGNAFTPFWSTPFRLPALYLGHNQELGASTHNAESFTITAMCLDYQ